MLQSVKLQAKLPCFTCEEYTTGFITHYQSNNYGTISVCTAVATLMLTDTQRHDTVTETRACTLWLTVERHLWAVCNDGQLHPATGVLTFNQSRYSLGSNDLCRQRYCASRTRRKCRARSPCTVGGRVTDESMGRGLVVEKRQQLTILHTQHLYNLSIHLQTQKQSSINWSKHSTICRKWIRAAFILDCCTT